MTRVEVGDEVYGDNLAQLGGFAELAVAAETALARKPAALSFAQAATLPQPGPSPGRPSPERAPATGC